MQKIPKVQLCMHTIANLHDFNCVEYATITYRPIRFIRSSLQCLHLPWKLDLSLEGLIFPDNFFPRQYSLWEGCSEVL